MPAASRGHESDEDAHAKPWACRAQDHLAPSKKGQATKRQPASNRALTEGKLATVFFSHRYHQKSAHHAPQKASTRKETAACQSPTGIILHQRQAATWTPRPRTRGIQPT